LLSYPKKNSRKKNCEKQRKKTRKKYRGFGRREEMKRQSASLIPRAQIKSGEKASRKGGFFKKKVESFS